MLQKNEFKEEIRKYLKKSVKKSEYSPEDNLMNTILILSVEQIFTSKCIKF